VDGGSITIAATDEVNLSGVTSDVFVNSLSEKPGEKSNANRASDVIVWKFDAVLLYLEETCEFLEGVYMSQRSIRVSFNFLFGCVISINLAFHQSRTFATGISKTGLQDPVGLQLAQEPPEPLKPIPTTGTTGYSESIDFRNVLTDPRFGPATGTRGPNEKLPNLLVLAPKNTGRTTKEQPTLFWYLSGTTPHPIFVTIIEQGGIAPLVEKRVTAPKAGGLQQFRLSDHNARLKSGVKYQWFVNIVPDAERRSKDMIAEGLIERVASPKLQGQVNRTNLREAARLYASSGIWYDALSTISEAIALAPDDSTLQQERAALLAKEGLSAM